MIHLKWKQALCCVLASAMLILPACSNQESGGSDASGGDGSTQELSVWLPAKAPDGNDKEIWTEIVKPFEEEHNVTINFEFISWSDYEAKYASGIQLGNGPDVGYLYIEMSPDYIDAGLVEELTPYLTEEDYEEYLYLEEGKIWGKTYGLVLDLGNPVAVFYNLDILNELGEEPPETWDDLRRIAQKATRDTDGDGVIDQWGLAQGWGQTFSQDLNWNWYSFIYQAGGDIFDEDGKVILDQEPGIRTATFLNDLKNTDHVLPDDCMSQTNSEMFANYFVTGKAAFSIGGINPSNAALLEDKEAPFEYGFTMRLADKTTGTRCGMDQLMVMSAAEDKELAAELVKFMAGPVGGGAWHEAINYPPTCKSEESHTFPMMEEALAQSDGVLRQLTPALRAPQVYEYLWKTLQDMMNGNISPEEAMKSVTEYGNSLPYERSSG